MIYIIEDDINIRQMESYALKMSGFDTMEFGSAIEFFKQCDVSLPKLIILDIMLPGDDGYSILKRLKNNINTADIPVIMVTAKTSEIDAVRGLDSGADDYITKPFGIIEFISRVKAVLRRTGQNNADKDCFYSVSGITLDDEKRMVFAGNVLCELTFKEYELLKYLMINKGIVLSRDVIMDRVWGFNFEGESRTVDVHIKTLRQKLGSFGSAVKTVRNVGYKIE